MRLEANVDGLAKLRSEARIFAQNYVNSYEVNDNTPSWRKYLYELCQNIHANSHRELNWKEETSGRSRLTFHLELLQFLNSRSEIAFEENDRLRILAQYAASKKSNILQVMNQHLSNQGNQFVDFLATLVIQDYPSVLEEGCFEIGGVEAYPFYDFLISKMGPDQKPRDYTFSQKGAVKNTSSSYKKVQYDYHLPLPVTNLSAIFVPRTFHWSQDKHKTIEHFKSALNSDGLLFIADLNKHSSPEETNPMEVSASFIPGFVEGNGFFDHDDCVKLLQEHGFTIEKDFTFGQGPVNVSYVLVARAP